MAGILQELVGHQISVCTRSSLQAGGPPAAHRGELDRADDRWIKVETADGPVYIPVENIHTIRLGNV